MLPITRRRGRRQSQLTILSTSFRNPITREPFIPKHFTGECSRKFARYVWKDPSFDLDLAPVKAQYSEQFGHLTDMSSNKRADTIIGLLKISGHVVENLYRRFLSNFSWESDLEKALSIEHCGTEDRSCDLEKVLELVCRFIGPQHLDLERGRDEGRRMNHETFGGELGPIDQIEPEEFRAENENNRTFNYFNNIESDNIEFDAEHLQFDRNDTRMETLNDSTDYS